MKILARIGQGILIIGLLLSIVGLVFGFGLMIKGDDNWAMRFLMIVPVGFVLMFTGLATSVMFSPRDDSELNKNRSLADHDD